MTKRGKASARGSVTQLFLTPREHSALASRFRRDVQLLHQRLQQGPHASETTREFVERLFRAFEELCLGRYASVFTWRRVAGQRGRPQELLQEPRRQRGRPKHDLNDSEIVELVDNWKDEARRDGRGELRDARAIAELLLEHAPPSVRRRLDRERARLERDAESEYAKYRALRQAIDKVESERFSWWVKRLDRARRSLRRRP
jgi:hypothetical protein